MESSLHRQLKDRYATQDAQQEVRLGDYRIDVVTDGMLVEIQHGALAAIRDKIAELVKHHRLLVVKPIVVRKRIVKFDRRAGTEISRRWSPKRRSSLNLFDELVHCTRIFPHRNLTLHVPLVEVEERRYPGHGRRRRRRENDFQVEDVMLVSVGPVLHVATADDLWQMLPSNLPQPFDTGQLAKQLKVHRAVAQRIAYCMYHMGAAKRVGKCGNALLYESAVTRSA